MNHGKRNSLRMLGACAAALSLGGRVSAQTFPSRAVIVMVPYPAGGASDNIARAVNVFLNKALGQPMVVENLGGAAGTIGAQKVINAPADGYFLYRGGPSELVLAPMQMPSARYKSGDFRLVQPIATGNLAILVRKDLAASTTDEFLAYAAQMAKQGKPLTYASPGPGSLYHLLGAQLSKMTGIALTHVPYKGGAPVDQALLSGEVDFAIAGFGAHHEDYHQKQMLKVLALLNKERTEKFRNYPVVGESTQLKGFTHKLWGGYFVRKETPEAVVQVLNAALADALRDSAVRGALEKLNQIVPSPLDAAQAQRLYVETIAEYRAFAKNVGLLPE